MKTRSDQEVTWPCVRCIDGLLHPWHDDGTVNEPHVVRFREANPVFDKDAEARRDG